MFRTFRLLTILLVACLVLIGCGGGGGGRSGNPPAVTAKAARFSIAWGFRSRVIQAPASALSATVTLAGASSTGTNLVTTVNRNASFAAYIGEYVTREAVKVGAYVLTARFFAGADATGELVGEGTANVTIAGDGVGIGTLVVAKTVASVSVVPAQIVPEGTDVQLGFTARDASGRLLALSPGSAVWSMPSASSVLNLTVDGVATGAQPGAANVVVTVDGQASPPTPILVSPAPLASVVVDPYQYLPVGWTKSLTFTAKDTKGNIVFPAVESVAWSLVDGEAILRVSASGMASALLSGTARVRVSAGGMTSAPEKVNVLPAGNGGEVPPTLPYFVDLTGPVGTDFPTDLSREGLTAVGYSSSGGERNPSFWKDPSTFAMTIPGLGAPAKAYLLAVSADGSVALGAASATFPGGNPTLFRLDGGQTTLPLPAGNASGIPQDLSADGTVALCTNLNQSGSLNPKPYVVRDGRAVYLPLPPRTIRVGVSAISGDGSTVVGSIDGRAVRWVNEGDPEFLAEGESGASGVSYDGRVVVGTQRDGAPTRSHPFRWTPESGAQPLPPSPNYSLDAQAQAVSDDGRTVLIMGDGNDGLQSVGQLWREGQGTKTLAELFAESGGNPASFNGAGPRVLSGDGRTIIGHGKRVGPGAPLTGSWKLRLP